MRNDIAADHAIVEAVADDDRALMERLAALEAEVKADADAQRARKAAAVAKLRDQRVTQTAGDAMVRKRTSDDEPAPRRRARASDDADRADSLEDLGGALELSSKANRLKEELVRAPRKGEKSVAVSGVASLVLGPAGWLYAGSLREAVPATAAWVALGVLASKILPVFLMMPLLMVFPLSAIIGVMYAQRYNRAGKRQRMFDKKDKSQAQLPAPRAGARGKQLRGDG
jgi:hypothetical protein